MKIPVWLATLIVGALFTLQGWTLSEIVSLKVNVAALTARFEWSNQNSAQNTFHNP